MNNELRVQIERTILCKIVDSALREGYLVSISNGGDGMEVDKSSSPSELLDHLHICDVEHIYFHNQGGEYVGSVVMVYGNDGWDAVSDCTINKDIDVILADALEFANRMEEEHG